MNPDAPNQPDQQAPPSGSPSQPPDMPVSPVDGRLDHGTVSGPSMPPSPDSANKNNKIPIVSGLAVLAVLIAVSSYVAFGTNTKTPTTASSNQAASASAAFISATKPPGVVSITADGFIPATIAVKVGQAVDWTNNDTTSHVIISDNPKPTGSTPDPNSEQAISPGNSYNYVFNKAGTYSYHDQLSTGFQGTVTVTN